MNVSTQTETLESMKDLSTSDDVKTILDAIAKRPAVSKMMVDYLATIVPLHDEPLQTEDGQHVDDEVSISTLSSTTFISDQDSDEECPECPHCVANEGKRVAWDASNLDKVRELFHKFIRSRRTPTIREVRRQMAHDTTWVAKLSYDRCINLFKKKDRLKMEYAILSRVKKFIRDA